MSKHHTTEYHLHNDCTVSYCSLRGTQAGCELGTEHVSGAGSERKMERSGPKIEWAGAEQGAGTSRNGNGAVSGLNWPLKFRSKVICYWNFVMLYKLYLSHVKNKLSIGILVPIGLCCFWISNFDVFVWTASTLRQHTTETSVIITGTRFSGQILHDTFTI